MCKSLFYPDPIDFGDMNPLYRDILIYMIQNYLGFEDLIGLIRVCKSFHRLIYLESYIWKNLLESKYRRSCFLCQYKIVHFYGKWNKSKCSKYLEINDGNNTVTNLR